MSFHRHISESTGTPMRFGVFTPPQARHGPVPVVYFLSGLTCTEETFFIKSGAQRVAAALGLMLVSPDTSPRGVDLPGDRDHWDFGVAAGFYVDATQAPWSQYYRMESYVARELPAIVTQEFPANAAAAGIFGHSMGGHGALTLGLKYPGTYRSISAFAPICAPAQVPWGRKAFRYYLGPDEAAWKPHDATALMAGMKGDERRTPILIDQGLGDPWLAEQLRPDLLEDAARASGYPVTVRRHAGYDHGYYFISTFIEEHLGHHSRILRGESG